MTAHNGRSKEAGRLYCLPSLPAAGRRRSRRGRLPESRDRCASRPLTPLTARNFQRAAAGSWEPDRQWSRRATRFPFPLPPAL